MDPMTGWTRRLLATALAALLTLAAAFSQAEETITYIHWDAQGSPVAATDQDGNVVWRESYRPYGERINNEPAAGPHSRWYTGHPQDEDTGLIYAGARYYDPVIGRFLGIDPVEFQEDNLHSFNRYAYGSNNPYRYVDPDGRYSVDTVIDAGFVIYDSGRFLGAAAAYGVGAVTGDSTLQQAGRQGMSETGLDLGGSALGMALPFVPSAATRSVAKYEVGTFGDLAKRSKGDGLEIHHAVQKHPARQTISGYESRNAPAIALPRGEHRGIPTTKGRYSGSARDLLAKDARDLRNNTNASNKDIQELIKLNESMYPSAFGK